MPGFSRLLCIRGDAGFRDGGEEGGVYPPLYQVVVREDEGRRSLQPLYVMPGLGPLGMVRGIVPANPDDPDVLLDACLAFFPGLLKGCPSLPTVTRQLARAERIDFGDRANVPADWAQLRREAQIVFSRFAIWEAVLRRVQ